LRIALLPDEYLPDGTRVHAKMFHELAHQLQSLGHDVVVITPGDPYQQQRLIEDNYDSINVWRFKTGKTRGVGKILRAINETMLSFNAWRAIRSKVKQQPFDLCINYSPTIFFGLLANKLKAHGTFVYLILRDMFPQWVIDQGMLSEGSPITRYFRWFERFNYRVSDCIGVMSPANEALFHRLHPGYSNVEVLMNWADSAVLPKHMIQNDWRKAWSLQGKAIFFYGGNIGHAQDMANLMRLARDMQQVPEAHFLFVGDGDEVELIKQLSRDWQLSNVTIKDSVSQHVYRELLTQVDVGLFSLAASHTAHNFPGKLLGYMIESLPILGSVNPGNDVIDIVNDNRAGYVFINGDDSALLAAAKQFAASAELRKATGEAARAVLEKYFTVQSAAHTILNQYAQNRGLQ